MPYILRNDNQKQKKSRCLPVSAVGGSYVVPLLGAITYRVSDMPLAIRVGPETALEITLAAARTVERITSTKMGEIASCS